MDPAGAQVSAQAGFDWKLALTVITALTALSATVLGAVVAVKNNNKNIASQIERERWETFRKLCSELNATVKSTFKVLGDRSKTEIDRGKLDDVLFNVTSLSNEIELVICNDSKCIHCLNLMNAIIENKKSLNLLVEYLGTNILKKSTDDAANLLLNLADASNNLIATAKPVLHKHLYDEFTNRRVSTRKP